MSERPFLIPHALNRHDALVSATDARKGNAYRCPECRGRVDLHAGEKRRRHFHHRPSGAPCSPESVTHLVAKQLIARAIGSARDGGPSPVFVRRCAASECEAITRQALPAKVKGVALEHALYSGRIVDVALLGPGDVPISVIEVHHTHAVDAEKTTHLPLPWIEVDATQVCSSGGLVLDAIQDHFLPWLCDAHAHARKSLAHDARDARDEARRRAAALRALGFDVADFPGYTAEAVVRCPNGHDAIPLSWTGKQPPWPRPPVVVAAENDLDLRFSGVAKKTVATLPFRRHFVTVCATCRARLDAGE